MDSAKSTHNWRPAASEFTPKESPYRSDSIHHPRPRDRRHAAVWWASRLVPQDGQPGRRDAQLAQQVGRGGGGDPATRVADEFDHGRYTDARPHGTASDCETDWARNWYDGDNDGPTEMA